MNRMNDLVEGCKITGDSSMLDGEDIYAKDMDVSVLRTSGAAWSFRSRIPFPMSIYDNIAYGPRTHGSTPRSQSWTRLSKRA